MVLLVCWVLLCRRLDAVVAAFDVGGDGAVADFVKWQPW